MNGSSITRLCHRKCRLRKAHSWAEGLAISVYQCVFLYSCNAQALLSLLFPLDIWTAATAAARVKQRVLSKAAEALDHVAAIRWVALLSPPWLDFILNSASGGTTVVPCVLAFGTD